MTIKAVGYIIGIYTFYLDNLFDILYEYSDISQISKYFTWWPQIIIFK